MAVHRCNFRQRGERKPWGGFGGTPGTRPEEAGLLLAAKSAEPARHPATRATAFLAPSRFALLFKIPAPCPSSCCSSTVHPHGRERLVPSPVSSTMSLGGLWVRGRTPSCLTPSVMSPSHRLSQQLLGFQLLHTLQKLPGQPFPTAKFSRVIRTLWKLLLAIAKP